MLFDVPIVVAALEFENLSGADVDCRFDYSRETGRLRLCLLRRGEPAPWDLEVKRGWTNRNGK